MAPSAAGCGKRTVTLILVSPFFLGLIILALLFPLGVVMGCVQHRDYVRLEPVEAQVNRVSVDHRRRTSGDGPTRHYYRPNVRFEYDVDGRRYRSRDFALAPLEYGSRQSVERILEPYERGQTVTAWYDPHNPSRAVLTRLASPNAYAMVLFGSSLWALVAMGWSFWKRGSVERRGTHFIVHPVRRYRERRRDLGVGTGIWAIAGVMVALQYAVYPGPVASPPIWGYGAALVYGVVGTVGMVGLVRNSRRYYYVEDAQVLLEREHLALGRRNPILYVQTARHPLLIRDFTLDLILTARDRHEDTDKTRIKKKVVHQQRIKRVGRQHLPLQADLRIQEDVTLPDFLNPTTPSGEQGFPRYDWRLKATLQLERGPGFTFEFPVSVRRPDGDAS